MSTRGTYRNALAYSVLTFGTLAVVTLASSVVTARLYGAEVVGQFALVLAPVGVLWVLSTVQEQPALVRELATLEPRAPRVTALTLAVLCFSTGLTALAAITVGAATAVVFNGPLDHSDLVGPTLILLGSYVCLTNVAWNAISVLTAYRAARQLFLIRLSQAMVFLVLSAAASFEFDSVWGLVWATLAASMVEFAFAAKAVRPFLRLRITAEEARSGFRHLRVMVPFGLKSAPGAVAAGLSDESGTWLLGLMATPLVALGAWSRAFMVARRLVEATHKVTEMLLPTIMERTSGGDRQGAERALIETMRYLTFGMLLAAAVAGGAADAIMGIFGPDFVIGGDALAVAALLPMVYGLQSCLGQLLLAENRPLTMSYVFVSRLILTVALSVVLIDWLGITGAAIGMVLGHVAGVVWMLMVSRRHLTVAASELWPWTTTLALAAAYAAGFVAGRAVEVATSGVFGLIAAVLAATAAYIGAFVLAGGVRSRDRERATSVVASLRGRRAASVS